MSKATSSSTTAVQTVPPVDPYRNLSSLLRKPTLQFIPPGTENDQPRLSELLDIEPHAYSSRLANKQVLLAQLHLAPLASGSSSTSPYAAAEIYHTNQLKPKQLPLSAEGGLENPIKGRKKNAGDPRLLHQKRMEGRAAEKKRKKTGLIGRQEAKDLGVWDVKGKGKAKITYESLIPLNQLHTSYLAALFNTTTLPKEPLPSDLTFQLASLPAAESYQAKLVKADFTGCILQVKEAKNKDLKGIAGIVIQETSGCFKLVTTKNKVKVIPKANSLFLISFPAYLVPEGDDRPVPRIEIDLLGSAFCFRTGDRAGRKFKIGGSGNGWGEDWVVGEDSYLSSVVQGSITAV